MPKKILACVDQSPYATQVADYAAWVSSRLAAPMELLHVIDRHQETAADADRSGALGMDAQENLLDKLSKQEGERSKEAREQGRVLLTELRDRSRLQGVDDLDIRQRYGQLLSTLEEQQDEVALYVLGRRGQSATQSGRDLGRHVETICRQLKRPIMTVTDSFKDPKRIMVAFDGGRMTRRGIELLAATPRLKDLPIDVVMSGKQQADAEKQLAWADELLTSNGFTVDASYIQGDPERVITAEIAERGCDLLIMGAYSHSPLRSLFLGSRTNDLLRASQVPTITLHL